MDDFQIKSKIKIDGLVKIDFMMAKQKAQDQGVQIPRDAAYIEYVKFRGMQRNTDIGLFGKPSKK